MLVQHRMQDAVESQLAETLAGFGRAHGCRDNVLVLRLLMDVVLRAGGQAVVTFIPRCLRHHQPPLSGRVHGSRQSVTQGAPHNEGHLRCGNGYGAAAPTEWRDDMFGAVSHQARRHPRRYLQPTVLHARAEPHLPTARHRGPGQFPTGPGQFREDVPDNACTVGAPSSSSRANQPPASRRGQLADKAVKLSKRKASAALLPPVILEGEPLEAAYEFDYLGCRFTSDGDDAADIRHRIAIAGERSRSLDYLWLFQSSGPFPETAPLRGERRASAQLSRTAVRRGRLRRELNGLNSRQLHRITGWSYRVEATRPSYDLQAAVRRRRHHWLGHIL